MTATTTEEKQQTHAGTDDRQTVLEAAVEEARVEVLEARTVLEEWEARRRGTRTLLEELQDTAGIAVLDAPEQLGEVAGRIASLQAELVIAEKAIEAQRTRITVAESAFLSAEAERLEPAIDAARAARDAHEAKSQRLVAELEKHEGGELRITSQNRHDHEEWRRQGMPGKFRVEPLRGEVLNRELRDLERRAQVARWLASGRDPAELIQGWQSPIETPRRADSYYPESTWGPEALVPAHAFTARVERLRELVSRLEQLSETARPERLRTLGPELAEARAALAAVEA